MSVGLGVFKQLRRVAGAGRPCLLLDPDDPGGLPPAAEGVQLLKTGLRLEAGPGVSQGAGSDGGREVRRGAFGRAGGPLDFRRFAIAVRAGENGGGS